ncbi:MAG: cobalamin-dependent protein, partial [Spirochaetes bacterium]|nr:cobalamin-dependent protein [Spirochaetota bacterium]
MKIAFVYIGSENLGLEYLSSLLKKEGHEVKLFYDPSLFDDKFIFSIPFLSKLFNIRKIILKNLIEYKPDLVGFTVFTDAYRWSIDMARAIKKNLKCPILFGGVHPTAVPEKVIREKVVDMVCVGEGFEALIELVRALEKKK